MIRKTPRAPRPVPADTQRNVSGIRRASRIAALAAVAAFAACGGAAMHEQPGTAVPQHDFATVTPAQWQTLASRTIYFGHQSVGNNLVDGVQKILADHPEIPLRVVEAQALQRGAPPGLYHARIGQNGGPQSKLDAFTAIADSGLPAVGMLKYCYVDVTATSNADSLFTAYRQRMEQLRQRHPGLVIVHMTMPLTLNESRKDWLKSKIRGRTTERDLNAIRFRYNELLRRTYAGKEPIFDLARLESTRVDGSRVTSGGVESLAREYTDDGGHLNTTARRTAAEALLALLANL